MAADFSLMMCRQYPVTDAAKVTKASAIQCYQYIRDICSWRLLNVDAPLLLGGQDVVVQIDESVFRQVPEEYIHVMTIFQHLKAKGYYALIICHIVNAKTISYLDCITP